MTSPWCTTRGYKFDFNNSTDRTRLDTYAPAVDGSCQTTTGAATTWTYDTADRPTTGYTYDTLGRTLTMPGSDTAVSGGGTETMTYYVNDMVRSISQAGQTNTYSLDVLPNRIQSWTVTSGTTTTSKTNYYGDDSDSPIATDEGGGSKSFVFASLSGIAGEYLPGSGDEWLITNLHGDFVAGVASGSAGLAYTSEYTETGLPRNAADAGARRYGYLGAAQRSADTPGGLTLMGGRLYAPGISRFLSVDPEFGGSCNSYDYTCGDPVGGRDLSGQMMVDPADHGISGYGPGGFSSWCSNWASACRQVKWAKRMINAARTIYRFTKGNLSSRPAGCYYGTSGAKCNYVAELRYRLGRGLAIGLNKYYCNVGGGWAKWVASGIAALKFFAKKAPIVGGILYFLDGMCTMSQGAENWPKELS